MGRGLLSRKVSTVPVGHLMGRSARPGWHSHPTRPIQVVELDESSDESPYGADGERIRDLA